VVGVGVGVSVVVVVGVGAVVVGVGVSGGAKFIVVHLINNTMNKQNDFDEIITRTTCWEAPGVQHQNGQNHWLFM
jgi:hypothetical protein